MFVSAVFDVSVFEDPMSLLTRVPAVVLTTDVIVKCSSKTPPLEPVDWDWNLE